MKAQQSHDHHLSPQAAARHPSISINGKGRSNAFKISEFLLVSRVPGLPSPIVAHGQHGGVLKKTNTFAMLSA